MKKALGFVLGVGSCALIGVGVYLMMSKKTKKRLGNVVDSAISDAGKIISKKIDLKN